MSKKQALVIVMNGVEELEALAPVDLLRRAGVEVTIASVEDAKGVVGRNGIRLEADGLFADSAGRDYDLIIIPGGPGHATLLKHGELLRLLSRQASMNRLIGSICAGPVVLQKAGVLKGKKYTSFPGTADALPDREESQPVVVDGRMVTSQGAGTALLFALALIEELLGTEKRREVAASICYPNQLPR